MTEKEITMEDLEETVKRTDEELDMMEWKMDNVEKQLVQPVSTQDMCVMHLLKSVSEVRSDYVQRELSSRLRAQLSLVHGKFARLRQRLATAATAAEKNSR